MILITHHYSELDKILYFEIDSNSHKPKEYSNWFWYYLGQELHGKPKPHLLPYICSWRMGKNGKPRKMKEIRQNGAGENAKTAARYISRITAKHEKP
jgi:hypothetical protein